MIIVSPAPNVDVGGVRVEGVALRHPEHAPLLDRQLDRARRVGGRELLGSLVGLGDEPRESGSPVWAAVTGASPIAPSVWSAVIVDRVPP